MPLTDNRQRVLLSWSSGKDSAWTLWQLQQNPAVEVVGLLTSYNTEFDRVAIHGVRRNILRRQAQLAGLRLLEVPLPWPCSNADYECAMAVALERAGSEFGASAIAFGDLYLEDVRAYRERQLNGSGLEPVFPLWGEPTEQLARQMIASGLKASISCLDPQKVPVELAGAAFDHEFLNALPDTVDPCGENGEFHTCVWAGQMFEGAISIGCPEVVERSGFVYADLEVRDEDSFTAAQRH